ncbi:MAG TPA: hypothetical protein VGH74_10810 [Planctomycetaceae bacterium]|jgi:hypothetical protein
MKSKFVDLVQSPSRETYRAAHAALIALPEYNPYSDELDDIYRLLDADKFDLAKGRSSGLFPNLLLSPRAHLLIAAVAEKSGDDKLAGMEQFVAAACVQGILATGDGSKNSPYLVCRSSDEYDVLEYLGKEFRSQALVEDGDRHFDSMECKCGAEIWFDITSAYNKLG